MKQLGRPLVRGIGSAPTDGHGALAPVPRVLDSSGPRSPKPARIYANPRVRPRLGAPRRPHGYAVSGASTPRLRLPENRGVPSSILGLAISPFFCGRGRAVLGLRRGWLSASRVQFTVLNVTSAGYVVRTLIGGRELERLIQAKATATGANATPMALARVVLGHVVGELVGGGADPTTIVRSYSGSSGVVERCASSGSLRLEAKPAQECAPGSEAGMAALYPAWSARAAGRWLATAVTSAARGSAPPHRLGDTSLRRGTGLRAVGADRYLPRRFQQRVGILETIAAIRTQRIGSIRPSPPTGATPSSSRRLPAQPPSPGAVRGGAAVRGGPEGGDVVPVSAQRVALRRGRLRTLAPLLCRLGEPCGFQGAVLFAVNLDTHGAASPEPAASNSVAA
jgi:hypothetical protein